MAVETAYIERRGRVGIVYINRPEVRNCIDATTATALRNAFNELEKDAGIDVAILTGVGTESFSSGLDLKELARLGPALIPQVIFGDTGWAGIGRRYFPKPLLSAVNGYAIAGGLELILSTDFAVAADHVRLGFNEATLGPIADAGGCFRLPHWVPLPFAREMLLTGRLISAGEAYRVGLVNHVVPAEQLLEFTLEIAERIASNSPSALRIMKSLVRETLNQPEEIAWPINDRYMKASFDTPDFMEGPRAFAEGRPAKFTR
jgi:enoyl-CoA hydratase/carnithine racemase